jgi:hypothetical protein
MLEAFFPTQPDVFAAGSVVLLGIAAVVVCFKTKT